MLQKYLNMIHAMSQYKAFKSNNLVSAFETFDNFDKALTFLLVLLHNNALW